MKDFDQYPIKNHQSRTISFNFRSRWSYFTSYNLKNDVRIIHELIIWVIYSEKLSDIGRFLPLLSQWITFLYVELFIIVRGRWYKVHGFGYHFRESAWVCFLNSHSFFYVVDSSLPGLYSTLINNFNLDIQDFRLIHCYSGFFIFRIYFLVLHSYSE